jgi:hypothetical protein
MLKFRSAAIAIAVVTATTVLPLASLQADSSGASSQQSGSKSDSFGDKTVNSSPNSRGSHEGVYYPTRKKSDGSNSPTPPPSPSVAGGVGPVTYHAPGTIMANPNSYVIWYGNWDANSCSAPSGTNSTASIIKDLVTNIGGTPWNAINATYYQIVDGKKTYVSNSIKYSGCAVDSGSLGLSLDGPTGPQVSDVVKRAISREKLPNDVNGVYLVLVASNVNVNGFLTTFCGYHSAFVNRNTVLKYSFIGDPSASLGSCISQIIVSPNGNVVADGMASVLAHELVEPISDPLGYSWFDDIGMENADKCAWTYGAAVKAADGSFSNMTIGGRKYLIQQNVAANTNVCVSSVPSNGREGSSSSDK